MSESDGTNETVYYHKDHLGSIVAISNSSGAAIVKYWYDAWGSRIGLLGATKTAVNTYINDYTHHGFTGHQQLDDYGLIHMNGRIYDPVIGRFQTADPNVFYPESTQGFNRFTYVDNNPLSYTDPSGFQKVWDSAANFVADEVVNFGDSMAEHPKITGEAIVAVGAVLVWTGVGSYYGYVLISYGADFYQKDAIAADPHPVASIDFSLGGSGGGSSSSSSNGTGGSGSVAGGGGSDAMADAGQELRAVYGRERNYYRASMMYAAGGSYAGTTVDVGFNDSLVGAHVLANPTDYVKRNVFVNANGDAQCAELIKQTLHSPRTSGWTQGDRVRGNFNISPGTAIATFVDGKYPNNASGQHAAIYVGQNAQGIIVVDQYKGLVAIQKRLIPFEPPKGGFRGGLSNNGNAFSVIYW